MKTLAIIGPTASGKSDLAIEIAQTIDAYILSLDSLAIYKQMDIVSAKPSLQERKRIKHFGIDICYPDEQFDVMRFFDLYHHVKSQAQEKKKNLIIVGGTLFYLKSLLEGLSPMPKIDQECQKRVARELQNITKAYAFLQKIDPAFAKSITKKDRYRIQKALQIYCATSMTPTQYFLAHPKRAIDRMPLYAIAIERPQLRERIWKRTKKMIDSGLIDEIAMLESRYSRAPHSMKAIGVKETLEYFDGKLTKEELREKISLNTAKLAKRQQTFIKTQLRDVVSLPLEELKGRIVEDIGKTDLHEEDQ